MEWPTGALARPSDCSWSRGGDRQRCYSMIPGQAPTMKLASIVGSSVLTQYDTHLLCITVYSKTALGRQTMLIIHVLTLAICCGVAILRLQIFSGRGKSMSSGDIRQTETETTADMKTRHKKKT